MNLLGMRKRNKDIIKEYKKGAKTLEQIGIAYGITKQRVCQIVKPALDK